jgi:hypothetical protein
MRPAGPRRVMGSDLRRGGAGATGEGALGCLGAVGGLDRHALGVGGACGPRADRRIPVHAFLTCVGCPRFILTIRQHQNRNAIAESGPARDGPAVGGKPLISPPVHHIPRDTAASHVSLPPMQRQNKNNKHALWRTGTRTPFSHAPTSDIGAKVNGGGWACIIPQLAVTWPVVPCLAVAYWDGWMTEIAKAMDRHLGAPARHVEDRCPFRLQEPA